MLGVLFLILKYWFDLNYIYYNIYNGIWYTLYIFNNIEYFKQTILDNNFYEIFILLKLNICFIQT